MNINDRAKKQEKFNPFEKLQECTDGFVVIGYLKGSHEKFAHFFLGQSLQRCPLFFPRSGPSMDGHEPEGRGGRLKLMTSRIKSFLSSLNDEALVGSYGQLIKELRGRGIVTNKNVTGELGEHMVIDRYSITPGLPKLRRAPAGTKNVDALSSRGDRYSIKTVTSKTTGSFYDLEPKGSTLRDTPVFEYLVVAVLDDY